ncbi:hypothetical protein F4802DRAFT_578126 [Xylaria palmicola]|nr:hypothetical protein F4802DRAFT_578126 [Xylaria palmicola]
MPLFVYFIFLQKGGGYCPLLRRPETSPPTCYHPPPPLSSTEISKQGVRRHPDPPGAVPFPFRGVRAPGKLSDMPCSLTGSRGTARVPPY